jgi:YggT family protein
MKSVLIVLDWLIWTYIWVLFAYVVLGLLMQLGVVNAYNRFVNIVYEILTRLCEPVLAPIRRVVRPVSVGRGAGLDFAPLILFALLLLLQLLLREYAWPAAGMRGL